MNRTILRRCLLIVSVVVGVQGTLWAAYWAIERSRAEPSTSRFSYEQVDPPVPAPKLTLEALDGTTVQLATYADRAVLLHFWATWCGPCRAELPSLLTLSDAMRATNQPELVLVSVDENWDVIRHYFEGAVPRQVVRDASRDAQRALGVELLPTTILLRRGDVIARMPGAQAWDTSDARSVVRRLLGNAR